ncbi:MAG TPA: STAS domain-containing protein [Planctomycetota bacterium]|jgi:anti-anti-sigma factor|nr:STAS domain-containing protein [Planctomycetota bacterium]
MSDADAEHIRVDVSEAAPGVAEIRIEGSLDWSNFGRVEAAIDEIFRKGIYRIVVNLKGCRYVSSAGFGCFIGSRDTALKHNGDVVFAAAPPEILDVFNILGLSKVLRFADDTRAALALLRR